MGKSVSKNNDEKYRGMKFNRLTIIGLEYVKEDYYGTTTAHWNWICRCDCGNIISVVPQLVRKGMTKSCGCLKRENTIRYNKKKKVKHGGRKDRLYHIWRGMKQRCYSETCKNYDQWGGRGISVCDEWKEDYGAFKDWALANGYSDDLSIDRIDVNGNYCPDNCRWATYEEQARNRRSNVFLEYDGKSMTIAEWAELYGISYNTLYRRIFYDGWAVERALTQPVKGTA